MNVWTSTDILSEVDALCVWLSSYLKCMFQICTCHIVTLSNYLQVLLLLPFCLQRNNREGRDASQRCGENDKKPQGPSRSKATSIWISGKTSCPQERHSHGTGPRKVADLHLWGLSTFSWTQPQTTRSSSGVQTSRQGCRDTSPPKFFCDSKFGKTNKQTKPVLVMLPFVYMNWIKGTDPLILWDRPPQNGETKCKTAGFSRAVLRELPASI